MGVAILMNGGPATMYGPRAYRAFQDFTAARTTGQTGLPKIMSTRAAESGV
jgi:hypothetical protein